MTEFDNVFGSKKKSEANTASVVLVNFKCSHHFLPLSLFRKAAEFVSYMHISINLIYSS